MNALKFGLAMAIMLIMATTANARVINVDTSPGFAELNTASTQGDNGGLPCYTCIGGNVKFLNPYTGTIWQYWAKNNTIVNLRVSI